MNKYSPGQFTHSEQREAYNRAPDLDELVRLLSSGSKIGVTVKIALKGAYASLRCR